MIVRILKRLVFWRPRRKGIDPKFARALIAELEQERSHPKSGMRLIRDVVKRRGNMKGDRHERESEDDEGTSC